VLSRYHYGSFAPQAAIVVVASCGMPLPINPGLWLESKTGTKLVTAYHKMLPLQKRPVARRYQYVSIVRYIIGSGCHNYQPSPIKCIMTLKSEVLIEKGQVNFFFKTFSGTMASHKLSIDNTFDPC
jgi:hypothetical protein